MKYTRIFLLSFHDKTFRTSYSGGWRTFCRALASALGCLLLIAGCASDTDSATQVVRDMYEAINKGDANAYMDTLVPSTRNQPDIGGILWQLTSGLSIGGGIGGLSADINLGGLLSPTTHDMRYTASVQNDGHMVVEARGKIRMAMSEYDYCESYDVVKEGGKWYIDRFHPARVARLQRYAERNMQRAAQAGSAPASSDPFADLGQLLSQYGEGIEAALDLCE